jgi:hypothetical protein
MDVLKFLEIFAALNLMFWGGLYIGKFITEFIRKDVERTFEKENKKR